MIRLSKITIENFKNVMNGQIDLASAENGPSILGLYGQNGSGKTSLVEAVQMLKLLFMGKVLPVSFGDAIHVTRADSPRSAEAVEGSCFPDGCNAVTLWERRKTICLLHRNSVKKPAKPGP